MAQTLLEAGLWHRAIEAALYVVAAEPLRESAHRVLIDAHVGAGNRGEALRQFRVCRTLLERELGLAPGPDLVAAAARARGAEARAALPTPDLSGRVTEVRLRQNRAPEDEPAEDKESR